LRVNATDSEAAVEVRRGYHTLKGSGRTVGLLALGEVAWSIENLLNQLMERKVFPTPEVLSWIEKVTADFAAWVAELFDKESVALTTAPYEQQANKLLSDLEQTPAAKPQKEEVLIGGTRKLSKAFFDIFLAEAEQHLNTLLKMQDSIANNTSESYRAAHTLGSNALTAGFKPIGDLARALEHWLDEHSGSWTEQHLSLYRSVVKALAEGMESVRLLNEPKTTRALINALTESTAAMQAEAALQAEAAVIAAEKTAKAVKKPNIKVVVSRVTPAEKQDVNAEPVPALTQEAKIATPKIEATNAEAVVSQPAKPTVKVVKAAADKAPAETKQRKDHAVNEELLALFLEEARELVPQIGKDLRGWRANPEEVEYPDSLQRVLHTLKGSARMAGLAGIGDSVHSMEDYVIRALNHKVNSQDFDTMFL
ncbi:MAG: Hpt domain-containing protein, partial [Methylotenera sp.]